MSSNEHETIQNLSSTCWINPHSTEPTFMKRIRLRAQRRILWLRNLWASSLTDEVQGLAISHNEVDRILADPQQYAHAEAAFYAADPEARQLSRYIHSMDRWVVNEDTWVKLREDFALSPEEIDLLTLTIAIEVEPLLRRVYGYLQDDATAGSPTPWLASSLFQWPSCIHFGPDAALVRWRMAWPHEGLASPWSVNASWMADPHIVAWFMGRQELDPALGMAVQLVPVSQNAGKICLYPAQLAGMQNFVQALQSQQRLDGTSQAAYVPIEIELIGPEGAGKRTIAGQFGAQLGCPVLIADAGLLLASEVPFPVQVERAMRAIRTAQLSGAVLYWHNADGMDGRVWQMVQNYSDLAIFSAVSPMARGHAGAARKAFRLPLLTRALRINLWKHLCDTPPPRQVTDWVLTPAEIVNAARVAPAGDEAVVEACRRVLQQGPNELFTPVPCPFIWDDIILSASVRQHLVDLENQARLRWLVYEEWGFERLFALGRGLTALFAGPSGTGKTMAAQVLARSLGMELYRVDLANVMSKYIGETEKRLKLIFDTCERANVLLFFDEADALFGQRTQVKDAHDRFANIEIDYLLQRMEQFDGIAVLATNRKGDVDTAFLRRLRFIVDFMQPGPEERLTLWHLALPGHAPGGEELLDTINWDFLATKLTMSGADIKAAALGAAFLARAQGTRITMKHVLQAARREMAKQGVVLRSGDWED